jgi:hypothetical protein
MTNMGKLWHEIRGKTIKLVVSQYSSQPLALSVTVTHVTDHGLFITYSTGDHGYTPWTSVLALEWNDGKTQPAKEPETDEAS